MTREDWKNNGYEPEPVGIFIFLFAAAVILLPFILLLIKS